MQHPILTGHDGGRTLTEVDAGTQWESAWREIASACERSLKSLHPLHPRRGELLALSRDARLAAGLPGEPQLRTA